VLSKHLLVLMNVLSATSASSHITLDNLEINIKSKQAEINTLDAIAQQCTQVAGRTKSAAAAMLPPAEGAQYWRENPDTDNCPQQIERDASFQTIILSLSPNPCSDVLHVQFDTPFIGDLIISDLSGRDVQHLHVQDKSLTLDIPVEQLNNGVYFLSSSTLLGKPSKSIKFVVLR